MAGATVATGITITGTGLGAGFEIVSVNGPNPSAKVLQTSHMGTTNDHTFVPGDLVDNGELRVRGRTVTMPTVGGAASEYTITLPDSAATEITFNAFISGFELSAELEELIEGDLTLKITGGLS